MRGIAKEMRQSVLSGNYDVLRQYIRKGKRKVGMLVAFKDSDEDFLRIGWSQCKRSEDEFNAKKAFEIAVGRACAGKIAVGEESYTAEWVPREAPYSAKHQIVQFVYRAKRYWRFC